MAADRLRTIAAHLRGNEIKLSPEVSEDGVNSQKRKFRFTLDCANGKLSLEQRIEYETNGFIVVKGLVPHQELDTYTKRFEDISRGRIRVPGLTVMKDVSLRDKQSSEYVVNKLQDLFLDDELFAYCRSPQILDYVENFTGPNIMAVHTMLINKPPDSGTQTSRHPLHQDLYYFPFRPADRIVCAWTAMEKVNRENGCLVAIPGSHRGVLLHHDYPEWEGGVNKLYHGITGSSEVIGKRVYLEMEKGDTVFFHPILIHGSGTNRSERFRKAISCHYAASECDYIDVSGTVQEKLANEVLEVSQKRRAKLNLQSTTFQDVWRLRAQLVRGQAVTI